MKRVWIALMLLAVMLSPLAMRPALAAEPHHASMAAMGHCDAPAPVKKTPLPGECAMACASALPAADLPTPALEPLPAAVVADDPVRVLHGISPPSSTPPPRVDRA